MMMGSGALLRFSRTWFGCLVSVVWCWAPTVSTASSQAASPELERALRAPIIEGQAAAGVRLGDDREKLARVLGEAKNVETLNLALVERYVYSRVDPSLRSLTIISVTFTIGQRGADSIFLIDDRQAPSPFGYVGRTSKGYRMGEGVERLKQLHGEPDVVFKRPPMMRPYYWYRAKGLVVSPEAKETDYTEAQIVVVKPDITREELDRLIFPQ